MPQMLHQTHQPQKPCDECGNPLGGAYYQAVKIGSKTRDLCIACHVDIFTPGGVHRSTADVEK